MPHPLWLPQPGPSVFIYTVNVPRPRFTVTQLSAALRPLRWLWPVLLGVAGVLWVFFAIQLYLGFQTWLLPISWGEAQERGVDGQVTATGCRRPASGLD